MQTVSGLGGVSVDAKVRRGFAKATTNLQKQLPRRETREDYLCLSTKTVVALEVVVVVVVMMVVVVVVTAVLVTPLATVSAAAAVT